MKLVITTSIGTGSVTNRQPGRVIRTGLLALGMAAMMSLPAQAQVILTAIGDTSVAGTEQSHTARGLSTSV